MTRKQIAGAVAVVAALGIVFVLTYRQMDSGSRETAGTRVPKTKQSTTAGSPSVQKAEIPSSIDDISRSIVDETSSDLSALDEEADGELSEIEADSQSINSLGESYDENNL